MLGLIETLLPGARHLRPALFSGFLWLLLGWLLISSQIPDRAHASGLMLQAYQLGNFFGPLGLVVGATALAFVLGTLTGPVVDGLARGMNGVERSIRTGLGRRTYVVRTWKALKREIEGLTQAMNAEPDGDAEVAAKRQRGQKQRVEQATERKALIKWRHFVWPSKKFVALLAGESLRSRPRPERELRLVRAKRREGAKKYFDLINFDNYKSLEDVAEPVWEDETLANQLRHELESGPLELLRALDEKLYLDLDRERSEREVRLAVSLPIAFIGLYAVSEWTPWAWILVVAAIVLFVQSADQPAALKERVLDLIETKGLESPVVRAVLQRGRDDGYDFVTRNQPPAAHPRATSPG